MMQERLNSLAIIATKYVVLQNNDFQNILDDFITRKLRKKNFLTFTVHNLFVIVNDSLQYETVIT